MTTRPPLPLAGCLLLLASVALADEPGVPSRAERRDLTLPALRIVDAPESADGGAQGLSVTANPRWKPADWPAALAARSTGGAVTARLPRAGASFTPGDVVVPGPPVGLLLQRAVAGSTARVARLDSAYQPGAWTTLSEPGYQAVSASLLDDGTGRVLWTKPIGTNVRVRLWHTDGAFNKLSSTDHDELGVEWVPFAHSQKYAAGLGYIAFRRNAAGAANNEIFVWHLGTSGGLPDQIVGGTWIPQQGTPWIPTGFTQVGRGGRLMFSAPEAGCPGACRLAYLFWIVNDQVQIMGGAGYEYYDTAMWDAVGGRLGSEWRAAAQADDEIFFVNTTTGAARLRFFDRLNAIALEKAYTPDAGYQFAGYTRTAVQHHVPDAVGQALLTNLLTRGCNVTNLATNVFSSSPSSHDQLETADMLGRSECKALFMELPPWGVLPNFGYASTVRQQIAQRAQRTLQFSFYLSEVVDETLVASYPDGSVWKFEDMCYRDATGSRFYPYGGRLCAPDLRKPDYWTYVEHTFNLALDNGFTNFIFGPIWFQDMKSWSYAATVADTPGDTGIVRRVARLREIAAARGVPVLIGGAYDGLSLESATAFDYAWHITNTPFQNPNSNGYIQLYEDQPCHPTSPGPYCPAIPWHYKYYSVVPMVAMQDTGWETNLFSGQGYSVGATATERARRRACLLQNIFEVHRRPERAGRVGFFPPMVAFNAYGARGIDGWPPPAPDYPVINCFGSETEFFYTASHFSTHVDGCPDEDAINHLLRGEPSGADCSLPTPPPPRDAQLVRTEVPPRMIAGQPYAAGVRYRNSGSVFWAQHLPVQPSLRATTCPAGWTCTPQTLQEMMAPADSRTLFAPVVASTPGTYALPLQLFDTKTNEWFGPAAPPVTVIVETARPDYEARFVSQKVPPRMKAGQSYVVPVTFQNMGSQAWNDIGPHCNAFRLTSVAGPAWAPFNRVELPSFVAAGETTTIPLPVTAPATPGTYNFQWRLLKECVLEFGDWTPPTTITVY